MFQNKNVFVDNQSNNIMDTQKRYVTTKGVEVIFVNNFKLRKVGVLSSGEKRWRCTIKTCKASCYTMGDENLVIREHEIHNHVPMDSGTMAESYVACGIAKRKAVEDLCENPSKIIKEEFSGNDTLSKNLKTKCRRSVSYKRRKMLPPLVKTLQ